MTQHQVEKHSDELDMASEIEAAFVEASIRSVQAKTKRSQEPDADGVYAVTECETCGEDIGADRLKVSIKNCLCIYCATQAERRR